MLIKAASDRPPAAALAPTSSWSIGIGIGTDACVASGVALRGPMVALERASDAVGGSASAAGGETWPWPLFPVGPEESVMVRCVLVLRQKRCWIPLRVVGVRVWIGKARAGSLKRPRRLHSHRLPSPALTPSHTCMHNADRIACTFQHYYDTHLIGLLLSMPLPLGAGRAHTRCCLAHAPHPELPLLHPRCPSSRHHMAAKERALLS